MPVSAQAYEGLPPDKTNQASALSALTRNIGASIGITLVVNVLHTRTHQHFGRLSEHVTVSTDLLGHTLASVEKVVYAQARMMSYLDVYWLMGVLSLVVLPVLFLIRHARSKVPAPAPG